MDFWKERENEEVRPSNGYEEGKKAKHLSRLAKRNVLLSAPVGFESVYRRDGLLFDLFPVVNVLSEAKDAMKLG